jgi:hypothetical protein
LHADGSKRQKISRSHQPLSWRLKANSIAHGPIKPRNYM